MPGGIRPDDRRTARISRSSTGIAASAQTGRLLALSAFSSYFAVKYHESATFDAATGINHERTEVRNEQGEATEVDLWTTCFTPRELRLMCEQAGLGCGRHLERRARGVSAHAAVDRDT